MVAGRTRDGQFELLLCQSPDFDTAQVPVGQLAAMGSGAPVFGRIVKDVERHLPTIMNYPYGSPSHTLAVDLGMWLERHLPETSVRSVGRVLQVLSVTQDNVTGIPYEIRDLVGLTEDRFETRVSVGIRQEASGEWIQYNGDGTGITLQTPMDLLVDTEVFRKDKTLSVYGVTNDDTSQT